MKRVLLPILFFLFLVSKGFAQDLKTYLEIAVQNNPGLQAEYKAYQAAMERIPQAASLPDPQLSLGYFLVPIETRIGPQQARLSLTQMFPWFGTLVHQKNTAALEAQARFQHFLQAQNKLEYDVAAAYYRLYELQAYRALETEFIALLETYKVLCNTQLAAGKVSLTQCLRVDILLENTRTELNILTQKRKVHTAAFNSLLNRVSDAVVVVPKALAIPNLNAAVFDKKVSLENPELVRLQLAEQAAASKEKVAVKKGLPQIGIGLDYLFIGTRPVENLNDNGKDAWLPKISVSLPVFRKKYKAAQRRAAYEQEGLVFQREAVYNALNQSLIEVDFKIQTQQEYLKLYARQIQNAEQSLRLSKAGYDTSQTPFEALLEVEQQILRYRKTKAKSLALLYMAMAERNYIVYSQNENEPSI